MPFRGLARYSTKDWCPELSISLLSESVLCVEQGFNATEQLSNSVAFGNDRRYAENFSEGCTELIFKHREDHDWRVRRSDVQQHGNLDTARLGHTEVQNYQVGVERGGFMECFVAVNSFTNLERRTGFYEGPHGVSNGSLVLGDEDAFGHG